MGFPGGAVGGIGGVLPAQVNVDGLGVSIRGIDGVAEVHEEGLALPTQARLDVGVREVGSVQEIG